VIDALHHLTTTTMSLIAQVADPAAPGSAAPKAAAAPGWFEMLMSFGPILFILVLFYIFIISAKRKEDTKRKRLLESLKKGDRVQTVGGMLGAITEVRDDRIQVKIDESANVKVWFTRAAITGVVAEEK